MKLKFINPATLDRNVKATIHKSGKLGFTSEAALKLGLNEKKSAKIAINDENPEDTCLYVAIIDSIKDESFKVNKAGDYYYLNTKALFDEMGMDYVKESIAYDITPITIEGEQFFKFKKRPHKSKGSKKSLQENPDGH